MMSCHLSIAKPTQEINKGKGSECERSSINNKTIIQFGVSQNMKNYQELGLFYLITQTSAFIIFPILLNIIQQLFNTDTFGE